MSFLTEDIAGSKVHQIGKETLAVITSIEHLNESKLISVRNLNDIILNSIMAHEFVGRD